MNKDLIIANVRILKWPGIFGNPVSLTALAAESEDYTTSSQQLNKKSTVNAQKYAKAS